MKNSKIIISLLAFILICQLISLASNNKLKLLGFYYTAKNFQTYNNMLVSKSLYSNVYYNEKDLKYITMIQTEIDTYYPILVNLLNINNYDEKVTVIVYDTKEKLNKTLGTKNVPMGAYYNGVINIVSPNLWNDITNENKNEAELKEDFQANGPILHELVHYMIDVKTKGNYDIWFTEGMALYIEKQYTTYEWRKDLADKNTNIDYEDLTMDYLKNHQDIFYRRSYEIVSNLYKQLGKEKIAYLTSLLGTGIKFSDALTLVENVN